MTTTLIIGLLIPLLGTMLGSAFAFFVKAPIKREKCDACIDSSEREVSRPKVKAYEGDTKAIH